MPNRYKEKGERFEKRVCVDLKENGFHTIQTRASLGAADIYALKTNLVLLIQAKSGEKSLTHDEWNALYKLADMIGGLPIIAETGAKRGSILYRRIMGTHGSYKRDWPWLPYEIDELAPRWPSNDIGI